ncbi:OadG family protein [Peptoniphilus equinus]|uniref:OadG family protein n=1 Tax=Peptoniphilus equinus TaxID=3016343 RepID=A0ABY7QT39_9FIRM|nr:OadG family protein [Peptoniphilus equinus]WBW49954.1 OadG family protein [Peptoniphilus equinus]
MELGGVSMWEGGMSIGQAVIFSFTGLSIVFLALISIALFVKLISTIVASISSGGSQKKNEQRPVKDTKAETKANDAEEEARIRAAIFAAIAEEESMDPEVLAALIGAVSREFRQPLDAFQIVSITEKF